MNMDMHGGKTMAANAEQGGGRRGSRLRIAIWVVAALLLLLPLVAMQFNDEVKWSVADFVVAAVLLFGTCLAYELVAMRTENTTYRFAVGVALAAALILIWLSLGVGIIGKDGDPANLMYFGVLAVGVIGALIARFRPVGMARALLATALAQALVAAIALIAGLGQPWSGPLELSALNGFFVALFVASAWLFRKAARGRPEHSAV
jgi:predicted membrane channel-forming protein YqfA (hemolysin III family)